MQIEDIKKKKQSEQILNVDKKTINEKLNEEKQSIDSEHRIYCALTEESRRMNREKKQLLRQE